MVSTGNRFSRKNGGKSDMLFASILFTIALQFAAIFFITRSCWPNIILAITALFISMVLLPAVIWLLGKKGHPFTLEKWQRRFLYVLFVTVAAMGLMYMLYAAGYEILDPQTFIPVNFILMCLGSDSCYLDYLYRKNRSKQSEA